MDIRQPGVVFPDHTMFVRAASAVAKCVNYATKFTFVPAGWDMDVHPRRLVDIRQFLKDPRDPRIDKIFIDRGRPVENPIEVLLALATAIDYSKVHIAKNHSARIASAGFLAGLGQVLAAAGLPQAQTGTRAIRAGSAEGR